jgi:hypothetical protein
MIKRIKKPVYILDTKEITLNNKLFVKLNKSQYFSIDDDGNFLDSPKEVIHPRLNINYFMFKKGKLVCFIMLN